jgi:hypothetical protein
VPFCANAAPDKTSKPVATTAILTRMDISPQWQIQLVRAVASV